MEKPCKEKTCSVWAMYIALYILAVYIDVYRLIYNISTMSKLSYLSCTNPVRESSEAKLDLDNVKSIVVIDCQVYYLSDFLLVIVFCV